MSYELTSPDKINYNNGSTRRNHNSRKLYRKEEPYLCPNCNKVWQPFKDYGSSPNYILEFPKIGCTTKICLNCKKDYKYEHNQLNELEGKDVNTNKNG